MGKGQSEYAWLFSLIIGAAIIFLAIYAASQYAQTGKYQNQAELTRQFDILLNPFSSMGSVATMTLSKQVTMPVEIRLNFTCSSNGDYDRLFLQTKSGKKYDEGIGYKIYDKYVYSDILNGKNFWIFSKPLELPWRIDDLIYVVGEKYCFITPPEKIKEEIQDLNSAYIGLECGDGKRVCFNPDRQEGKCDITVSYSTNIVKKNGESLLFAEDALMYAAVFSDNALYKCNLDRLMHRLNVQTSINNEKAILLEKEGCNTKNIQSSLRAIASSSEKRMLLNVKNLKPETIQNNPQECPIF